MDDIYITSGPDDLNARILKERSSEIAPVLAYIFNESLAQGTVPDDSRLANVFQVFKKGEKYDASNYRLASLTCICCKTLEHIIVNNINKAFDSNLLTVSMVSGVKGPAKPNSSKFSMIL